LANVQRHGVHQFLATKNVSSKSGQPVSSCWSDIFLVGAAGGLNHEREQQQEINLRAGIMALPTT
jgi:hypothetical protein